MPWNHDRAKSRILEHLKTVPEVDRHVALDSAILEKRGLLSRMPLKEAFVVEGAHLYGQLLDFDDLVTERGQENEAAHRRLLRFMHMHIRVWDSLIDGDEGDRIDYHGGRLHAVVVSPSGDPAAQIERAVALARKLTEAAFKVGAAHGFPSRIRFGIDHGKCLAMTTGRGAHERDTLFLGRPANHAAKLVANGSDQGIFLTETAQKRVAAGAVRKHEGVMTLDEAYVEKAAKKYAFDSLDRTASAVASDFSEPVFRFTRPTLPLSTVKFSELSPANSVRSGMASIFADIDGFTNFVDQSILGGSEKIREAVKIIHVIREELNSVLKDDFGGKRVRFIGDCIHGCLAEGDRTDDPAKSVRQAVLCGNAMWTSFRLCLEVMSCDAAIDLAIGIEYGPTPMTRLGQRGDDSIRCAASRATIVAEQTQQAIEHGGMRLGDAAVGFADHSVRKHFASGRLMSFDSASDLLMTVQAPAVQILRSEPAARSHAASPKSLQD
jgi:class 3 adenylate cyclase